jgi:hypothetical protein
VATEEEIARRMTAIHQVDWAFAILLVIDTFSLNIYSSLPPPIGPIGGPQFMDVIYAMCVVVFLGAVLRQSLIGRFLGWFFALLLLEISLVALVFPTELIPLYSLQRFGVTIVFFLVSYVIVSVGVTKAYMARVQQVSSPEDYFHSASSFACEEELKQSARFWQRLLGPLVVLVPVGILAVQLLLWLMKLMGPSGR